eukprot:scaffold13651_cov118-Skeletonema_dohrnii-CCMP3373.AAC.5
MKNQPHRLLPKNRKSSERRQSSNNDDDSSIENDGWITTQPKKESASLSLFRDGDRSRSKQVKTAVSFAKKPSSFAASNDSDGSSSSSDSDDSHVNIISKRNKKKTVHNELGKSNKTSNLKSKKSSMPRATFAKVANRVSKAGTRASTTPENAPSSTAASIANKAPIPEGITSPSQLQWYRIILGQSKKGTREKLQPCRKLSRGEVFEYKRKHGNGGIGTNNQGTTMIEYLSLSNDNSNKKHYLCVDDNLLIPFGYRSRDGISFTFNDDYLQRYMQEQRNICTPSQLETQKLFIERVFSHAIKMEKETKEDANRDLEDYYDDCSVEKGDSKVQFDVDDESEESDDDNNERSDDEELDIPYTQAISFDPDNFELMEENETSNEPIRVGDVVQYYSPIHVAGDPRGLRRATVLAIDPKKDNPLVLDNAEYISSDTNVKRIKVMSGGELVDHPGIFRPIFRFKLVKAGRATIADAMKMQSSRFGGIMRNNMKKLKSKAEAEGFAPMDLINMKGMNDSSQSSSEVSVPKPKASRKVQHQPLPSSSSESSDDDSSDDESPIEKSKPLASNTRDVEMMEKERAISTPKLKENQENASSPSRRDRKFSLGSLDSSKASLGTSLASSDDDGSSIESVSLNLGKNHKNMTQHRQEKKQDDVRKKTHASGVLDLSISSDESVHLSPKKAAKKNTGVTSTKKTSLKEYLSSDSSVSSESSLEVIKPKKLKKASSYTSSSCSTTSGPSKQQPELRKRTPVAKKPSSSYSSSASKASLSESSSASSTKRKRTPKTNRVRNSSKEHSSASSNLTSTTKQRREPDSEATKDLGWTQTSGGWVKSNENAGFSLSIGRFKK